MKTVNITQHWDIMINWLLLLKSFYFFALTFVSHDGTLSTAGPKSREIKCLVHVSGFVLTGCKHTWLKWDLSIIMCRKGNHVCSVFLHSYLWLLHFNRLSPSGLFLVWCCTAVFWVFFCFCFLFTVCDCFLVGALWEPLIVDVPLQFHQHPHDFPPVVESTVYRTFCKTCL